MSGEGDVTLGEVNRSLEALRELVEEQGQVLSKGLESVRSSMLSKELFESENRAMRTEFQLQVAGLRAHFDGEVSRIDARADEALKTAMSGRALAMWAVGLLSTLLFAAAVLILTEIVKR